MRAQLLAAVRAMIVFTVVCGLAYPLLVTGAAQVLFPDRADGSLVRRDGVVVGSSLLGQTFTGEGRFHGRPSAAGPAASGTMVEVTDAAGSPTGETVPPDGDDLAQVGSGASNLGPTNPELIDTVAARVRAYRSENGLAPDAPVPVDAVTTSASGVDPQISVANARLQAQRVADARGLDEAVVLAMVDDHTVGRSLGFLGEAGVNVLALNLAVDEAS
jgi:K+-transporting ATPase ATPase C chain